MFIPGIIYAQVLNEDFESGLKGEWLETALGRWEADSVDPIKGLFSLHHSYDNSESACDQIGVSISGLKPGLSETVWKFKVRHAYNPSSMNNWSFFLMSDGPPPEMRSGGSASGYALGVNLSGYDDTLRLWKIVNGSVSAVVSTALNWQNDIGIDTAASLTVKRTAGGYWEIYSTEGHNNMVLTGEGHEPELFHAGWTGIMFKYSSSQDRRLWIDDVIIEGYMEHDTEPPRLDTVYFSGMNSIRLQANEVLAEPGGTGSYQLYPGEIAPSRIIHDGEACTLEFEQGLENKMYYDLHINNICDQAGNCCDTIIHGIALAFPECGDIVISEIMFDPEPPAGLPPYEYLEIYNKSGFDFNTSWISAEIRGKNYSLPGSLFRSGEHVLLVNESDTAYFSIYGSVLSPGSSFSLNNTGEMMLLRDSFGAVIHGVEYNIDWYASQLKKEGGWSLELIDYNYPFSGSANWSESRDKSGGTPGRINSVNRFNPDIERPLLTNIYPLSARSVRLVFSETMGEAAKYPGHWSFKDNLAETTSIADPLTRIIDIGLRDSLARGIIYEIGMNENITDRAGNLLMLTDNRFGIPLGTAENDILFNEIMYDPLPGDAEFIEFYNPTDKIVDPADHFLVSYNSMTSDTGKIIWLSDECRCLMPGDYYVITTDREALINAYSNCDEDRIFELAGLPSLPDQEGNLLLFNRNLTLIDKMHYSDDMHFIMLSVTAGISLERVATDIPATVPSNWRSASAISGYASPGMLNSAASYPGKIVSKGVMSLSQRKISPDGDGFEDYLEIILDLAADMNIITLEVYNDTGYPVRKLADKLTAGYSSTFIWDGYDDNGHPVREGIYIICSSIVSRGRPPELIKRVCTVVH
ncbi:MAG: hypothetical protein KFF49_05280 [Bacteroidales bacterium]|nr:hypothetical protein [Bacteroidales bacterium]